MKEETPTLSSLTYSTDPAKTTNYPQFSTHPAVKSGLHRVAEGAGGGAGSRWLEEGGSGFCSAFQQGSELHINLSLGSWAGLS